MNSCKPPKFPITPLRWGFTLIAFRGSQENHAAGVIEALNDGFFSEKEKGAHVKLHFHFTGEEIEHKDRDESGLQSVQFTRRPPPGL